MPTISAIIATYNRCAFLQETIASLEAQTRPVDQIVIWDDGSTDGTESYGTCLAAHSQGRIIYRRSENGGKSRALNRALEDASGELIWVCDDDDIALPHASARLSSALERSNAGLSAGRHDRFRDNPMTGQRELFGTGYWPDLRQGSILRHVLEDVFFFQNATLVRRAALDRVGPFREDLARSIDYEMFVRLVSRFPVEMVDDVLFHQRKHDGARGPAASRHEAGQSEAVWLANDRAIFTDFRSSLPLSLYEALFHTHSPSLKRRAALIQRATVYARRNDWNAALEDWTAAATAHPSPPLTATERDIVIRAMAGKHGCGDAFVPPVANKIRALHRLNTVGADIVRGLGRGAIWRIRSAAQARDPGSALRAAAFVLRAGLSAARDNERSENISEKRTLARHDYEW